MPACTCVRGRNLQARKMLGCARSAGRRPVRRPRDRGLQGGSGLALGRRCLVVERPLPARPAPPPSGRDGLPLSKGDEGSLEWLWEAISRPARVVYRC